MALLAIAGLSAVLFYYCFFARRRNPSLPPGPKPLPIVGNLFDLPPGDSPEYLHWLKFKDLYGTLSCVTIFNTCLILIQDKDAVRDLLENNSINTSARPELYFANNLCGFGVLLGFLQYDSTFRHHRRLVHQQLGTRTDVARFRDAQDIESHRLLLRILDDPMNLVKHLKTETSAIILRITYGYSIEPRSTDPLVDLIQRMMYNISLAFVPGAWPVDFIPFLKYLPEGLPCMSFKKVARKWSKINRMVIEAPYAFVRQQMAKGIQRPSYVASLVEQHLNKTENGTLDEDLETAIKRTAAVMYAGAADTTVSSIHSFILAMVLFPEVQRKAQEEIDTVVGTGRLPEFEDRGKLSYVDALVKETLRWLPVAPTGIPHMADDEINYRGFCIPKGAYLVPGTWWFLHDPQTYSNPSCFDPDRYLEPRHEPDPAEHAFGYGRRICPGKYLADETLFLTIARILAVFDITKAIDKQGKEITPKVQTVPGVNSRPVEFPYNIKPRSAIHTDLIQSVEVRHPWEESDSRSLPNSFDLREA